MRSNHGRELCYLAAAVLVVPTVIVLAAMAARAWWKEWKL